MAVLTKSALAQLLANIAADVANDTAHPNLAGLYNQSLDEPGDAISPVFRLRDWEVPYVVVTPGEVLLRSSGGGRRGRHAIGVHLVHTALSDENGRDETIGTVLVDGIATLLEVLEEADAAQVNRASREVESRFGALRQQVGGIQQSFSLLNRAMAGFGAVKAFEMAIEKAAEFKNMERARTSRGASR